LSVEPLLGPVDLHRINNRDSSLIGSHSCIHEGKWGGKRGPKLDWIIVGGESGHGARPCDIEWIRSIVRQCKEAGVSCFTKQLGKWVAGPHDFEGWKGAIDRWLLDDGTVFRRPILRSEHCPQYYDERPKNAVAWGLADLKGGEIEYWPKDVQVREMPQIEVAKGVA